MYYTHHFAHHETLRRACAWLHHFGFRPDHAPGQLGTPWLAMPVVAADLATVEMLVNVIERTDPEGWPSFWDEAQLSHSAPAARSDREPAPTSNRPMPIGWHPIDAPGVGNDLDRLREAMGH